MRTVAIGRRVMSRRHEMSSLDCASIDVVSTDVFDTLLLRDWKCETSRCIEIAKRVSDELRVLGHTLSYRVVLRSRLESFALAYRSIEMDCPTADIGLNRLVRLQAKLLGLDQTSTEILRHTELACEHRRLSVNRPVLEYLRRMADRGKRVIATSDTYLSQLDLAALVTAGAPDHPIACFYSSSDMGATKRSGELFRLVAAAEGIARTRIFHFGDSPHSDVTMARQSGLKAELLPRSRAVQLSRKVNALQIRLVAPWTAL